ncbi:MAG: HupE/UreJ family protein [Synechococcus sp.]
MNRRHRWPWLTTAVLSAVVLLSLALGPTALRAHELLPALLELDQTGPERVEVLWRRPLLQGQPLGLTPVLPDRCRSLGPARQELLPRALLVRSSLRCRGGLQGQPVAIEGLGASGSDVLLRWRLPGGTWNSRLLQGGAPMTRLQVTGSGPTAAPPPLADVLRLGVEHILLGPDHLLFVLGLLLIVPDRWMLLKTITAFTAAHSLTLAAATVGVLRLPAAPLEAAIALSILLLAPEIVRRWRGGTSLMLRQPWLVAFGFGLLHGAGLAGGLQELGLPKSELVPALLLFNVGVELGQLAFVVVLLLVAQLWRQRLPTPMALRRLPGYVVGIAGAYWTFERTWALLHPAG